MIQSFQLHRPTDLQAAADLLMQHGDEAGVIAGGTELLLVMKLGLADYPHLVDIKRIPQLSRLERQDGLLAIGATVTHRQLERSAVVRQSWPALGRMTANIANPRVRGTGTVGGNLCFADPHSDVATFLLAADARLVLQRGLGAPRRLAVGEFLTGIYETAIEPGELLLSVEVPAVRPGMAFAHERFSVHERPAVTVTTRLSIMDSRLQDVRLSVGCVGPKPLRLKELEQVLEGRHLADLDAQFWAEVSRAAAAEVEPAGDGEGTVAYTRHLVGVLLARAGRKALGDVLAG